MLKSISAPLFLCVSRPNLMMIAHQPPASKFDINPEVSVSESLSHKDSNTPSYKKMTFVNLLKLRGFGADSGNNNIHYRTEDFLCELICCDRKTHETQRKNQNGYYCNGNSCRSKRFFLNNWRMPDLHEEEKDKCPQQVDWRLVHQQ